MLYEVEPYRIWTDDAPGVAGWLHGRRHYTATITGEEIQER